MKSIIFQGSKVASGMFVLLKILCLFLSLSVSVVSAECNLLTLCLGMQIVVIVSAVVAVTSFIGFLLLSIKKCYGRNTKKKRISNKPKLRSTEGIIIYDEIEDVPRYEIPNRKQTTSGHRYEEVVLKSKSVEPKYENLVRRQSRGANRKGLLKKKIRTYFKSTEIKAKERYTEIKTISIDGINRLEVAEPNQKGEKETNIYKNYKDNGVNTQASNSEAAQDPISESTKDNKGFLDDGCGKGGQSVAIFDIENNSEPKNDNDKIEKLPDNENLFRENSSTNVGIQRRFEDICSCSVAPVQYNKSACNNNCDENPTIGLADNLITENTIQDNYSHHDNVTTENIKSPAATNTERNEITLKLPENSTFHDYRRPILKANTKERINLDVTEELEYSDLYDNSTKILSSKDGGNKVMIRKKPKDIKNDHERKLYSNLKH